MHPVSLFAAIKEIKVVWESISLFSDSGFINPEVSTGSSVSEIFGCFARILQVSRTEGCSIVEVIRCCSPEANINCRSTALLLSEPPLVNIISRGSAPNDLARLSRDSSRSIFASRPAQCGLEGLPIDLPDALFIAVCASGSNGEVAL